MISLTAIADRTLVRTRGNSVRHLHVRIVAPARAGRGARAPVSVAFVIDRSGSMAGERLALARQATSDALEFLSAEDRFGVVTFESAVETIVAPTLATSAAIAAAKARIMAIEAAGSTALCEGWLTGCAQIDAGSDAIARCLLLTDGHANVGERNPATLAHHAGELRARGVATTTFGLGAGFSEELLQGMAQAGGGHFYFIEHAAQIRDFFTSELGEALEVVARDVEVSVAHPAVKVVPLTAYAVRHEPGRAVVRVGDLCSAQVVDLIVELTFPDGTLGQTLDVTVGVSARADGLVPTPAREVRFAFGDDAANNAQARTVVVDRLVAGVLAADARRQALVSNRERDYRAAEQRLRGAAERVRQRAAGDPELVQLADSLDFDATVYGSPMDEIHRKRAFHTSTSRLKGRDESTGRARKLS